MTHPHPLTLLAALTLTACAGETDLTPRTHAHRVFRIHFERGTTVVDEWRVEREIAESAARLRPHFADRDDFTDDPLTPSNFCCGTVSVDVQPTRPYSRWHDTHACGITIPQESTRVWEGCLLEGGLRWETTMHLLDVLYPGRPEADDIEWLNTHRDEESS